MNLVAKVFLRTSSLVTDKSVVLVNVLVAFIVLP